MRGCCYFRAASLPVESISMQAEPLLTQLAHSCICPTWHLTNRAARASYLIARWPSTLSTTPPRARCGSRSGADQGTAGTALHPVYPGHHKRYGRYRAGHGGDRAGSGRPGAGRCLGGDQGNRQRPRLIRQIEPACRCAVFLSNIFNPVEPNRFGRYLCGVGSEFKPRCTQHPFKPRSSKS